MANTHSDPPDAGQPSSTAEPFGDRSVAPAAGWASTTMDGGLRQQSSIGAERQADAGVVATVSVPLGEPEATALPATPQIATREISPHSPTAPLPPTTGLLLETVLGLAALVLFSYVASKRRFREWEEKLGIHQLITAGLGFIGLGMIARALGWLTPSVVSEISPILEFGLGWLGFVAGFRFDVRALDQLPHGTARAVALTTTLPLLTVGITSTAVVYLAGWLPFEPACVTGVSLGMAGAVAAPRIGRFRATLDPAPDLASRLHQLDEIAVVAGLALLACYHRPSTAATTWVLPGTVWLFILLGVGVSVGLVIYMALSLRSSAAEFLALTLGSVAFASGMAGYLHLPPLVVCFVAGALIVNLPLTSKGDLARTLGRLERPLLFFFLALAGGLWELTQLRGWVLLPVFLGARVGGKWLAAVLIRSHTPEPNTEAAKQSSPTTDRLIFAPLSVMSIAVVFSVKGLYPAGENAGWTVTAVLAGALVTELLVRHGGGGPHSPMPERPINIVEQEEAS